jgi:hypothetical protein
VSLAGQVLGLRAADRQLHKQHGGSATHVCPRSVDAQALSAPRFTDEASAPTRAAPLALNVEPVFLGCSGYKMPDAERLICGCCS